MYSDLHTGNGQLLWRPRCCCLPPDGDWAIILLTRVQMLPTTRKLLYIAMSGIT